jgi:hypothetical protein
LVIAALLSGTGSVMTQLCSVPRHLGRGVHRLLITHNLGPGDQMP